MPFNCRQSANTQCFNKFHQNTRKTIGQKITQNFLEFNSILVPAIYSTSHWQHI